MRALLMTSLMAMALSSGAIAAEQDKYQTIELKDGSQVHVHKDGKMTMEDRFGKPMSMKDGSRMETKDGKIIMMKGNEVWRLHMHEGKLITP